MKNRAVLVYGVRTRDIHVSDDFLVYSLVTVLAGSLWCGGSVDCRYNSVVLDLLALEWLVLPNYFSWSTASVISEVVRIY